MEASFFISGLTRRQLTMSSKRAQREICINQGLSRVGSQLHKTQLMFLPLIDRHDESG